MRTPPPRVISACRSKAVASECAGCYCAHLAKAASGVTTPWAALGAGAAGPAEAAGGTGARWDGELTPVAGIRLLTVSFLIPQIDWARRS